eukprot:3252273-Ditylum_brightwellii.AAC.1
MEKAMRTAMVKFGGDDKNFDGGIGRRSSHGVYSSWHLRCHKGDENCHGRSMSSSFQTIKSQTRLSTSRSSVGRGEDNT